MIANGRWLPCLAALVLSWLSPSTAHAERPNILLIMAEDMSPRVGAYGDQIARTPNIDRLASEGMRFERAFTSAGVCAPSRSGIIMGVHADSWGAGHMRVTQGGYAAVPPPEMKAFPELLRAEGYYTMNARKTDYQLDVGMDGFLGGPFTIWDDTHVDDWRGRPDGQPFFAYLTLEGTHESQVWPTWKFPRDLMQLAMLPMRVANHSRWIHETDPADVQVPPYYPDTPTVREDIARHYNNIEAMDAQVGLLLAKLEQDGLADRTIVIWTTDHGDGLPRAKRWPYDSGIRIPLIIRWPGVTTANSVNEELVSGVDFAPTILQAAGVPIPDYVQGRVFLGPGTQPEPEWIRAARGRIDEHDDRVRALRDRRYKYVRHLIPDQPYVLPVAFRNTMPMMQEMNELSESGALEGTPALWFRQTRDTEELFDTATDPHEIHNLAGDPAHAEQLERMRTALDQWLATSGDLGLLPEEELAERFWPGGVQPVTAMPTIEERDGRVHLASTSEGASIGFSLDEGSWQLYTTPFPMPHGSEISAKAIRYGWAESGEATTSFPDREPR
ncbi:MAG: sulfatase [bacterium]|nr:sulfatase [bacterium]MCP5071287.1 sulfatase [bacterium]